MPEQKNYLENVQKHLADGAEMRRQVASSQSEQVVSAAKAISDAVRRGGKLMLCGNGGSAADCQHMAAELVSRLTIDFARPGIAAIALTTDTSFMTAFANDCGFEGLFARQVQALGKPEDILLGISTSGNSLNVILAFEEARKIGMRTVALTGQGGRLPEMADFAVRVPSTNTQHIQESHLAIEHLMCYIVERELYSVEVAGAPTEATLSSHA